MVTCETCGEEFANNQGLAGHKRMVHGEAPSDKPENTRAIVTKAQPLDMVIENLRLPQVPEKFNGSYNVYVAGFNDGVMHGARSILAGIRAAQELSSMGVQQAVPLIKMAQEMRQAEGQAAQILAGEMNQSIMQSNQQTIAAIHKLAESQKPKSAPDPMQVAGFNLMMQLMGQAFRATGMGGVNPTDLMQGVTGGSQPGQPQGENVAPGISERSRAEWRE